jgi:histidinol phosphatase-like enzyme (inositol monophosphatase family)
MTPPPCDAALLEDAVALARAAGDLTLPWFRSDALDVEKKADGTPVTQADRAAEAHVRAWLAEHHPDDGVLGEEEAEKPGTTGRRWIVDPIDGTKAFTRGVPLYTTLLAVEDEHGIVAGVIHVPALGETVWAGRGLGAFCDGAPARVSDHGFKGGVLTTSGFDYWPEPSLRAVHESPLLMRTWGDGYGYVLVATGRAEAMVDPIAATYDLAPMPVIITEAGGRFSDWTGADRIDGGNGLATNGLVHDDVLAALNA